MHILLFVYQSIGTELFIVLCVLNSSKIIICIIQLQRGRNVTNYMSTYWY